MSIGPVSLHLRSRATHLARRVRRQWVQPREVWQQSISHELEFWQEWADTRGSRWPDDYARRVDPLTPITEELITRHMPEMKSDRIAILDVGAGPATVLGKTFPGKNVTVTPVDPLADEYNALLDKAGVRVPVRTVKCAGEDLLEVMQSDTFDFAHSRNALDHAYDPLKIIQNMVAVVKPGGYVVLRHWREEGRARDYHGLHQWDFRITNGDFEIAHAQKVVNVTRALAGVATVECVYEPDGDGEHILCTIRKLPTT